ncbi:rhomboid family intramembrane serine protease [Subsaximicrobium wynnwilliamsii]|uniref:Rhomboid family intramembrane serine protease n=1 Tax=Subsaximicrobium wynnwilliamsii TaxID=291179 RepID=A0A5C6ZLI8_9FLAO|nr:rhomboid family intramembrane serine protease [Subsaximicrobium wynnwilliamsii]TXD85091.1 rhomboid family intramembrane serine protease [Subsaximicrobium wynnwilliamsii]TXD91134.1 rhomboid family intramembrane serine protease [Subsaximicrobium wynnwilliamsii]TXE04528.1 rhomboid family intramembrane serine protease [Subsaximicrobium wynnwilliamsii]
MTSLNYDFKEKLKNLNVFEKIMIANVLLYLLGWLIQLILKLPRGYGLSWLELPRDFTDFIVKPWSLLTYGFTHYDFLHLLFNMLVLYFVSRSMVNMFPSKQSLNIYFMGILAGGFSYLLIYNVLPESMMATVGALVGASAGVNALLIFLCTYMPNQEARFFTIRIKLWHIGVAIVVFDIIGLFGVNQGGKVAHLGGSLLGYLYASNLLKGSDIGIGFGKLVDQVSNWFKPKSNLKTVHRTKKKPFAGHNKNEFNEFSHQKKIDIILDKISKSGYESLTKEEKEFLFKAGK